MSDLAGLVPWLLEQIAEDERLARAAQGESQDWSKDDPRTVDSASLYAHVDGPPYAPAPEDEFAFIRAYGPSRVLAECAVKRQIVGLVNLDFFEGRPQFARRLRRGLLGRRAAAGAGLLRSPGLPRGVATVSDEVDELTAPDHREP